MLRNAIRLSLVTLFLATSFTLAPGATAHAQTAEVKEVQRMAENAVGGRWVTVSSRGQASTLWGIATMAYGSGYLWPTIYNANRTKVFDPRIIYPGQRLWIPNSKIVAPSNIASVKFVSTSNTSSSRMQRVVRYALNQIGDNYKWLGEGPNSFDCSGLVKMAFKQIGYNLYHQSYSMLNYGTPVSRKNLQPGDIVWPEPGHVAIYIGNNKIVHAANYNQGVIKSTLYGFWKARRLR